MDRKTRADYGSPVEPWIEKRKPALRVIARKLHRLIRSTAPRLKAQLKWGMPHYTGNTMVCALMGARAHITLFFHYGKALQDPGKLLQGSGKWTRHLKFTDVKQIPVSAVKTFVKGAVARDRKH